MAKLLLLLAFVASALAGDIDQNVLEWQAPQEMQDNSPYQHASDVEASPLWVFPLGEWPLNENIRQDRNDTSKYIDQMFMRMAKSGKEGTGYFLIMDLKGFGLLKNGDPGFILNAMRRVREIVDDEDFSEGWIINGDLVFTLYWTLGKGALGSLADKITYYGPGNKRWKKHIRAKIPLDKLPEAYGGTAAPVQVFG